MKFYCADLNTTSPATTQRGNTGSRKLPNLPHLATFAAVLLVTIIANLGFTSAVCAQQSGQQPGQQYDSAVYSGMRWRLIGPHRAGCVTTVAEIPGRPATYYFGTPGGGLWKTTTGGRVWQSIFDDTHEAAIGALALAPSSPDIIYVGTGEKLQGNGVYRSADGGSTRLRAINRQVLTWCRDVMR
jgi:hypothetical protein